jgi:hypothetical protein
MLHVTCKPEFHRYLTAEEYAEIHAGMQQLGLLKKITRNGRVWLLPDGFYVGINLSTSLELLDLQINALAFRITGRRCQVVLTPVPDPANIYFSGLKEEESSLSLLSSLFEALPSSPSYEGFSALAILAGEKCTVPSSPSYDRLSALMTLKGGKNTVPPVPDSLQLGYLMGYKS